MDTGWSRFHCTTTETPRIILNKEINYTHTHTQYLLRRNTVLLIFKGSILKVYEENKVALPKK